MPHLMIIDRDAQDARQIAWMLGNVAGAAFDIEELNELPESTDELAKWDFDLLLLAPGGEGEGDEEALTALRQLRETLPALPVILLDGQARDELGRRAIQLGAQDYLVKSQLDPTTLGRAVLHALERSRAERAESSAVSRGMGAILDHLPHGVVFLDRTLKVLFANRPARALLSADAPIRVGRDQRLRVMDVDESRLLGALITATLRGEMEESARALLIGGKSAQPLAVMVATIGHDGATLFINAPHAPPSVDRSVLESLYGLTPAESRLVALLTRGLTLDAIAKRANLSPHTLRTQLKQIFRKSGTSRQSELIKLILTGPAVIAPGS